MASSNSLNNAIRKLNNSINAPKNNTMYSKAKSSPITYIVVGLVFVILLAVFGNWLYNYYKKNQDVPISTIDLLLGENNGNNEFSISANQMPPSTYSNEYALSFWVYVEDYNYRRDQPKYILRRGSLLQGSAINPEVLLLPYHNTLQVNVGLQTAASPATMHPDADSCSTSETNTLNSNESFTNVGSDDRAMIHNVIDKDSKSNIQVSYTNPLSDDYFHIINGLDVIPNPGQDKYNGLTLANAHTRHMERYENNIASEEADVAADTAACPCPTGQLSRDDFEKSAGKCFVKDFPLQKWVHIVLSQYNQVMDVYIDGALRSSCALPGFPAISTEGLVLSPDGGYSGKFARLSYHNTSLGADEVHSIYRKGPSSSYKPFKPAIPVWAIVLIVSSLVVVLGFFFNNF